MTKRRVLLAGETWISHITEVKGFTTYATGELGSGHAEFTAALEAEGHAVRHIANHDAPRAFPETIDELGEVDVVILSDIAADSLLIHPDVFHSGDRRPDRLRLLDAFVAGGGGLLMVGGYMSFSGIGGQARYHGTPLARVLPVEMLGYDDRVEEPEGVVPVVAQQDHPVLAGVDAEWPDFLGYNRFRAKPDATVLLTVEEDPFLVVAEHEAGRVAAFASDCSPHWGSPRFLAWPSYARFWSQLVDWLAAGTSA